jgi:hypothetical protein
MSTRESRPTGAAPESSTKTTTDMITVPTDCCRETTAEVVREVTAALADLKAATDRLWGLCAVQEGDTYTLATDDPSDEPRDAYVDAPAASCEVDDLIVELRTRVRRVAWLHDLDHSRTR